jgi:hypothetical protein
MPFVRVRENLFCAVMSGLLFTAGCALVFDSARWLRAASQDGGVVVCGRLLCSGIGGDVLRVCVSLGCFLGGSVFFRGVWFIAALWGFYL